MAFAPYLQIHRENQAEEVHTEHEKLRKTPAKTLVSMNNKTILIYHST